MATSGGEDVGQPLIVLATHNAILRISERVILAPHISAQTCRPEASATLIVESEL
jgi:hypothetical protein